jgi:Toprim-like
MFRLSDSPLMPKTGETPESRLANAVPLMGTPGQSYVEKRGIPVDIAHEAGVCFDSDWDGRAAVLVPMRDPDGNLCSVHGRYLEQTGQQDKMLTIGPGGGAISVGRGWRDDPIILVEGLFDALSLALCGCSSVATVGRWAPWLPQVCAGKVVWLAFDGNRPGESEAARYKQCLTGAHTRRLPPPGQSKDWNTALVKRGRATVEIWLERHLAAAQKIST